jgi:hypothetical protein
MHNPKMYRLLAAIFICSISVLAVAQGETKQPSPPAPPAMARAEDVGSIDAILAALYDVISGPAGKKRDWDRFKSLYLPDAKMGVTAKRPDGSVVMRKFTPEEYVNLSSKVLEEQGFFEKGIHNHVDQFGQMAQVFSTYESRHTLDDAKPFQRGINQLLLWNDGKRWWIMNIFWQGETADVPIPEKFLKGG